MCHQSSKQENINCREIQEDLHNRGGGGAILTPNELVLTFGVLHVCVQFGENRQKNATVRVSTDGQTHARTDAKWFYYLSHAICYSYGADNYHKCKKNCRFIHNFPIATQCIRNSKPVTESTEMQLIPNNMHTHTETDLQKFSKSLLCSCVFLSPLHCQWEVVYKWTIVLEYNWLRKLQHSIITIKTPSQGNSWCFLLPTFWTLSYYSYVLN